MVFVRKLRSGAELRLIRRDSKGITGTYENVRHHAAALIPYVQFLEVVREDLSIAWWGEAHNVHVFQTTDGRHYKFRPLHTVDYVGIELCQTLNNGIEIPVFQITDMTDAPVLLAYLHLIARPWTVNTFHAAVRNRDRLATI
jgi:hypothetical protein